jgi:hypothetical protein
MGFSARGEANDEDGNHRRTFAKGYEKAPEICRHVWHTLLQEQTEGSYSPDLGWQLRNCLDEPLREFLRQRLSDNTVPIGGFRTALPPLLEQRDEESIASWKNFFSKPSPGDESGKQRAVAALQTLMNFPTQGNWDVFRSLLDRNPDLAVEAVPHIADADGALGQEEIDFFPPATARPRSWHIFTCGFAEISHSMKTLPTRPMRRSDGFKKMFWMRWSRSVHRKQFARWSNCARNSRIWIFSSAHVQERIGLP